MAIQLLMICQFLVVVFNARSAHLEETTTMNAQIRRQTKKDPARLPYFVVNKALNRLKSRRQ
jgi:hypothetical protein